jgi:multiple sugar transport system substrate-binding protein
MRGLIAGLLLLAALSLAACGEESSAPPGADDGPVRLRVWVHSGQPGERAVIRDQVARFNAAEPGVQVELTIIPEGGYNAQVQAAALAGDLPDVLEFDGPFLYSYAWQGHLRPLDGLLPAAVRDDLLPSLAAQGSWNGRLYAVGAFDSGLGLWGRKSLLEAVGARLPAGPDAAWSAAEFAQVLERLAERDSDGAVLDLKLNYTGEWFTYAFSPVLQSAGADLLTRAPPLRAGGVLDSAQAVAALRRVQDWIRAGRVDPNLDDAAFTGGRVALSWAGHWEYPRYRKAVGDDLVLLPLPDFGAGSRTGQGSWNWAITTRCDRPEAAARFLGFLLQPDEVLAMTAANGAVPGTRRAVSRSPLYGPAGPLRLFVAQLGESAVPRPRTPAYPVITSAFQKAFQDIRNGLDVEEALWRAAALIDQDIQDNRGYRAVE